jgi:hypothetical protein
MGACKAVRIWATTPLMGMKPSEQEPAVAQLNAHTPPRQQSQIFLRYSQV